MTNVSLYQSLSYLREKDEFHDLTLKDDLINTVFPKTVEELAFRLSNVTGGFYGLLLKQLGQQCGSEMIDPISKALFRELGQLKATEAQQMGLELPSDTRALAIVSISAIYTSSPEYNIEIIEYTPDKTSLMIFGVCRYYRIAKRLGIEQHLTWPTLIPFFEGITTQLGIVCKVEMEIKVLKEDGACEYLCHFVR